MITNKLENKIEMKLAFSRVLAQLNLTEQFLLDLGGQLSGRPFTAETFYQEVELLVFLEICQILRIDTDMFIVGHGKTRHMLKFKSE